MAFVKSRLNSSLVANIINAEFPETVDARAMGSAHRLSAGRRLARVKGLDALLVLKDMSVETKML